MIFSKQQANRRFHRSSEIPDNQRIYAIGDIHGRADLLLKMRQAISKHAAVAHPADNYMIYLGDYIDRGLQVKEVMDILTACPLPEFKSVFLRGNHEEMLLAFLMDASVLDDWLPLGGQATLLSYGVTPLLGHAPHPVQAEEIRRKFLDVFPGTHHDFLVNLKTLYQAGDYLFVHAGLRPGVPLDKQHPQDFVWIREPFLSNRKSLGLRVVHGHHITPSPEISAQRIGVDTGAYATGRLSCVVLEADQAEFIMVKAGGE
jgi:serine/threonine protein phosphatase 1